MEDLVEEVVDYLRLDPGAATVQALLGVNPDTKVTADYDPANVARPTIFVLLPNSPTKYNSIGNAVRVENPILNILCFTNTRAEAITLLNTIESVLIQNQTLGLGPPHVTDKIAQLDLSKLDVYKGTLNLQFFIQQNQTLAG